MGEPHEFVRAQASLRAAMREGPGRTAVSAKIIFRVWRAFRLHTARKMTLVRSVDGVRRLETTAKAHLTLVPPATKKRAVAPQRQRRRKRKTSSALAAA
jgi:hypothetical protein